MRYTYNPYLHAGIDVEYNEVVCRVSSLITLYQSTRLSVFDTHT